jgi:hypothetical protein
MNAVLFLLLPLIGPVVSAALVAASALLYVRFRSLAILVCAFGAALKLAYFLLGYFFQPSVTFSEHGEVLSRSMPPEWIMTLGNVLGHSGNLFFAGGLLVFAWQVRPNKRIQHDAGCRPRG